MNIYTDFEGTPSSFNTQREINSTFDKCVYPCMTKRRFILNKGGLPLMVATVFKSNDELKTTNS